jgi:hypothetical protein
MGIHSSATTHVSVVGHPSSWLCEQRRAPQSMPCAWTMCRRAWAEERDGLVSLQWPGLPYQGGTECGLFGLHCLVDHILAPLASHDTTE